MSGLVRPPAQYPHGGPVRGLPIASRRVAAAEKPAAFESAFRGLLRRKWLLAAIPILASAGAAGVAYKFGSQNYTYFGKLLYAPNRATMPYYDPPELGNLVDLAKLPKTLEAVRDEFGLTESLDGLQRQIKVEAGSDATVNVTCRRPSADESAAIVDRVLDLTIAAAADLRKQSLTRLVDDFRAESDAARLSLVDRNRRVDEFLDKRGFRNVELLREEVETLRRETSSYEQQLSLASIAQRQTSAQRARLLETFDTLKPEARDRSSSEDAVQQAAYLRPIDMEKRNLLQEQLRQQQEAASLVAQRRMKQREYERSRSLHDRQLISDAAFERVRGELEVLLAQESEDAVALRRQIDSINQKIVTAATAGGSLAGGASLSEPTTGQQTIALLEGSEEAGDFRIDVLSEALADKTAKLEQATKTLAEARPLIEEAEAAEREWVRLDSVLHQLSQSARSGVSELVPTQRATPLVNGVASNHTKLFGAALVGLSLLGVLPAFVAELRRAKSAAEQEMDVEGAPLLGRAGHAESYRRSITFASERFGLLAVRLRSAVGEGPVTLLVACEDRAIDHRRLCAALAEACSRGGEAVAVLDFSPLGEMPRGTALQEPAGSGESDAKHAPPPVAGTTTLALRPATFAVSPIDPLVETASGTLNRAKLLATVENLRAGHSIVMLVAPKRVPHVAEALAGVADGTLWTIRRGDIGAPSLAADFRRFARAGAPTIGVIGAW